MAAGQGNFRLRSLKNYHDPNAGQPMGAPELHSHAPFDPDSVRSAAQAVEVLRQMAIKAAREDPIALARYAFSDNNGRPWDVAPFHREIQGLLSEHDLMVIHAPIKHGKTEQVSVLRVIWELGRNPNLRVCIVSNTFDLAEKVGHAIRTHCESNERLLEVFPHLRPGRRWREHGFDIAGRRAAGGKDYSVTISGIEGPVLGSRFDLVILDDPNNSQNTATAAQRDKVYGWVKDTLIGRLDDGGRIWAIGTAWNQDDLLYRLINDGWAYKHYRGSSLGHADGDPLWPRPGQIAYLRGLLDPRKLGEREYARQIDNNPISRVGGILQREWFVGDASQDRILDHLPLDVAGRLNKVRFWDLAATDGSKSGKSGGPCYTAGVLLGLYDGMWYLLDVRRIQGAPDKVERLIVSTAHEDGTDVPIYIEQEPGSASIHLEHQYQRRLLVGFAVRFKVPKGDKVTRAVPVGSAAEKGLFRLVRGAWNPPFLEEAESFPYGAFKDQVDALSGAFSVLAAGHHGEIASISPTWL